MKKERGFIIVVQGEHTYPVRLNQYKVEEEEDGKWERRKDWWVKGRKDRMKKEEARSDSQSRYKGGKTQHFLSMMYNSTYKVSNIELQNVKNIICNSVSKNPNSPQLLPICKSYVITKILADRVQITKYPSAFLYFFHCLKGPVCRIWWHLAVRLQIAA